MMRHEFLMCVVLCAVHAATSLQETRLVQIAQGPVRGYKDPESGVFIFKGIPYASAPTGTDRFKAPLPPPTWMYPLEAVNITIACPQVAQYDIPPLNQQENCLIASVYVPDTQETNLPVIAYVHGGGFQVGTEDWFKPIKIVATMNIITVTFNYRLGVHGFLCLGTEDIPGNAGMKDQVAALHWIKRNIASFGGNPDDVTLQGSSAGSAAVDLLMLSKSAEGLFDKVIPESGASVVQWAIQPDPLQYAKKFAIHLNFTNVDDIDALDFFYKTAPFELLGNVPFMDNPDLTFGLSPCVERNTGSEVFLDKSPVEILKSGDYRKVPLLYGFSEMEGLLSIVNFESFKHKINDKFSDFLPADLEFKSEKDKENVANQIKEFYFGDKPIGEDTILGYVDYFTDALFAYSMLRAVKYHVNAGHDRVYLYEYSFVDELTPFVPHTEIRGATHCSQSGAVFGGVPQFDTQQNLTQEFIEMSDNIVKIWGTFVKTGYPIPEDSSLPEWPPVGLNMSPHMSFGSDITLRGPLLERRMRFWDEIYSTYYHDPIPPPELP